MKKYVAFEIDIPEEFVKTQTEDTFLYALARLLKETRIILLANPNDKVIHQAEFSGNWEFIDTVSPAIIETKEKWEARTRMKIR